MHYTKSDQSHGAHAVAFVPSGQHWLFFDPNAGTFQLNSPEKFTAWWNNYYKAYFFTGQRTLRYIRLVVVEKLPKEVGQTVSQENLVTQ